jgi:hypothetical protein
MRHFIQYGGFADGRVYFSGVRRQRGAGLGGIFGAVARHLIPFFKKFIMPHAASAVGAIASDIIQKKPLSSSIKEHGKRAFTSFKEQGKQALKRAGTEFLNQSGSGKRRKRSSNTTTRKKGKRTGSAKISPRKGRYLF